MARPPRVLMSPEEGMHVFHPGQPRGGDPDSGMAIVALDQVEGQPTSQSKEDCTMINATRALAEKDADIDVLRQMVQSIVQRLTSRDV